MRGRVQPGLTILMLVLMLIAPAQGILCQQACALCMHPQENMIAATASSHCSGMAAMGSQKRAAQSVLCCQSRWSTDAVVVQGSTPDTTEIVNHGREVLSAPPVTAMPASIERVAPPGVPHSRFIAMRV
jgi:hypothetical protein